MSEAKFTPGPWILATVPTSVGSCHKIGPFPGAGHRPYTYACVYADGIRPGIDDALPAAIELTANARLMAAAPDLFAELQNIANAKPETWDEEVRDQFREWAQSRARAAIAKATGA